MLLPHLCHDEPFLEVGVDLPGGLRGLGPLLLVTMEMGNKQERVKEEQQKVTHNAIYKLGGSKAHPSSWMPQASI